jgi:hypothetical protein
MPPSAVDCRARARHYLLLYLLPYPLLYPILQGTPIRATLSTPAALIPTTARFSGLS